MGQKVHPQGFRVGITEKHLSTWFSNPHDYRHQLEMDQFIRTYITDVFRSEAQIAKILTSYRKYTYLSGLSRTSSLKNRLYIEIHSAKPKFVLTATKNNVLLFQKLQQKFREKFSAHVRIQIVPVNQTVANSNAKLIAETIGTELEARKSFRRSIKRAIKNAGVGMKTVGGIKVQISGRLNGVEMARTEWLREGRVPLQTLRAKIDYYQHSAQTLYGLFGIKVWVFLV